MRTLACASIAFAFTMTIDAIHQVDTPGAIGIGLISGMAVYFIVEEWQQRRR